MNGAGLTTVDKLLGHTQVQTTNRYAHLDDATLGNAAERVARAIEKKLRGDESA